MKVTQKKNGNIIEILIDDVPTALVERMPNKTFRLKNLDGFFIEPKYNYTSAYYAKKAFIAKIKAQKELTI